MRKLWSLQRHLPEGLRQVVRRLTTLKLRNRLRERLAGTYRSIPETVVRVADGRRFRIGPDHIYWSLYVGSDFEPAATSVVRRMIRPGDTVLDVGANFGWYTTLFQRLVGDAGKVYAFEPVPAVFARLMENLALNGMRERVEAVRTAIGEGRGEVAVHVFDDLPAAHSSLSSLGREDFETFSAPMVDLTSFLGERAVERVDFMKCDVEGSELKVLKGSRGLLASATAPNVLVELNRETAAAFGFAPTDIWAFLREVGYDQFYAVEALESIRRVESEEEIAGLDLLLCGKSQRLSRLLPAECLSGRETFRFPKKADAG